MEIKHIFLIAIIMMVILVFPVSATENETALMDNQTVVEETEHIVNVTETIIPVVTIDKHYVQTPKEESVMGIVEIHVLCMHNLFSKEIIITNLDNGGNKSVYLEPSGKLFLEVIGGNYSAVLIDGNGGHKETAKFRVDNGYISYVNFIGHAVTFDPDMFKPIVIPTVTPTIDPNSTPTVTPTIVPTTPIPNGTPNSTPTPTPVPTTIVPTTTPNLCDHYEIVCQNFISCVVPCNFTGYCKEVNNPGNDVDFYIGDQAYKIFRGNGGENQNAFPLKYLKTQVTC